MIRRLRWQVLGVCLCLSVPVLAKEGDTLRPFVSAGYYFDNNLFRLDDNDSPGTQREDRFALLEAGLNVDWKVARQQFTANLTKTLIRYNENTFLDFDGEDLEGRWNWRLGNRLSGTVGATRSTSQSSFDDIDQFNNQVDRERRFGRAEWEFHPRWRISAGIDSTENLNSAPSQRSQNVDQEARDITLGYKTPKGSSLRAQVRKIDATFPNPQIVSAFFFPFFFEVADNSYTQTEYNMLADWALTGKLTLRGQAGRVDRHYENVLRDDFGGTPTLRERPDFEGFTGRASLDWFATSKTLVNVAVFQELGGATDINASSVLRTGGSVSGVWAFREKWRLNVGAEYLSRDYKGDVPSAQPARTDETLGSSLSLNYRPHPVVSLDMGILAGKRDSNRTNEDYDYQTLFANIRADF